MLLAIDVGNTHIKYAIFSEDLILRQGRMEHANEMDFDIQEDIKAVVVCSVVPRCDIILEEYFQQKFGLKPFFVTYRNSGLAIDLKNPEQLGADRIVNALAALAFYSTPAVVIDFGTATTFDVIDSNRIYRGGVIVPGINLSFKALSENTAKLPVVQIKKPDTAIGRNTQEAMQSGLFFGYLGVIERIVHEITAELNDVPFVLATGGLGVLFAGETELIEAYDPDLTLKGLARAYRTFL